MPIGSVLTEYRGRTDSNGRLGAIGWMKGNSDPGLAEDAASTVVPGHLWWLTTITTAAYGLRRAVRVLAESCVLTTTLLWRRLLIVQPWCATYIEHRRVERRFNDELLVPSPRLGVISDREKEISARMNRNRVARYKPSGRRIA